MKVKDLEAIPHITFGIKDYVAKVESQLLKDLNHLKYEIKDKDKERARLMN